MIDDTNTDATEEVTEEEVAPTAGLSIQDLANLRNIVNVASQRGAFKAEEFTVIGATYTRLNDFLNSAMPPPAIAPLEVSADADEAVIDEADTDASTEE